MKSIQESAQKQISQLNEKIETQAREQAKIQKDSSGELMRTYEQMFREQANKYDERFRKHEEMFKEQASVHQKYV